MVIEKRLSTYIDSLSWDIPEYLQEVEKDAVMAEVPVIKRSTQTLLAFLLDMAKPAAVLEIGTAVAFSAGLMSRYLQQGGTITTIDRFEVMLKDARENIKKMNLENVITILEGDAADILPTLQEKYDVIFLDAAKGQYGNFLPHCIRLLPVGGILIVDDVLQGGSIAKTRFSVPRRQRTIHKRMRNFLWDISHNAALESCILPVGDGVAVCYKKSDE